MEDISPRLQLVWEMQRNLQNGLHLNDPVLKYIKKYPNCLLAQALSPLFSHKVTQIAPKNIQSLPILHRQILILTMEHLKGESISENLAHLEREIVLNCEQELAQKLVLLPYKLMLPLLGLIFPAMMMVLLVPLIRMLQF